MARSLSLVLGDCSETAVYAVMSGGGMSLMFKFLPSTKDSCGLPNRIFNCYHEVRVGDSGETFPDRKEMRKAIQSSICSVWDECTIHPCVTMPDAIVEVYEDGGGRMQWRICLEGAYKGYAESLLPISDLLEGHGKPPSQYETVYYSDLINADQNLGGRGISALVRKSSNSDTVYVFKGVFFGDYLQGGASYEFRKTSCYTEIRTLNAMPRHPNIIPPKDIFVTAKTQHHKNELHVCGTLTPFFENGTLDDHIVKANSQRTRLSLEMKAKWCFQLASAVSHTHHRGHTYHMDLKPSNILLNSNHDLLLIDWGQNGAPRCTAAPEVDGSWDVELDHDDGSRVYKKYQGPARQNSLGWPEWNIFPIWKETCPTALEAAEVFSVGRTIWMLLNQTAEDDLESQSGVEVAWDEHNNDVSPEWKCVAGRCLERDPNKRPSLVDLVSFWEMAVLNVGKADEKVDNSSNTETGALAS